MVSCRCGSYCRISIFVFIEDAPSISFSLDIGGGGDGVSGSYFFGVVRNSERSLLGTELYGISSIGRNSGGDFTFGD